MSRRSTAIKATCVVTMLSGATSHGQTMPVSAWNINPGTTPNCIAGTNYIQSTVGGMTRWSFNVATGSCLWMAPVSTVQIFAVGGGGGGTSDPFACMTGGGGGGYFLDGTYTLQVGQKYLVTVGTGGAGGNYAPGGSGSPSGVGGIAMANGGSGGGTLYGGSDSNQNGGSGGSGGGCGGAYAGASGAGGAGGSSGGCGNGAYLGGTGSGLVPSFTGYGSGGGGAGSNSGGLPGSAGGANAGNGGNYGNSGTSATPFFGGGGGGGGCYSSAAGNGGSGAVFITQATAGVTPTSCLNILKTGASTGNGIYTIAPLGVGSISVYCDMTYDGGGWTLVASSNGTDASGPVVNSLTSTTAAGILTSTYLVPLANNSSSIRFTQGMPATDASGFISTASGTLSKMRSYQVLNNSARQGASPNTDWSPTSPANMYFNCAPGGGYSAALSSSIYHGCGNSTNGLHWVIGATIKWSFSQSGLSNLNLWVK